MIYYNNINLFSYVLIIKVSLPTSFSVYEFKNNMMLTFDYKTGIDSNFDFLKLDILYFSDIHFKKIR